MQTRVRFSILRCAATAAATPHALHIVMLHTHRKFVTTYKWIIYIQSDTFHHERANAFLTYLEFYSVENKTFTIFMIIEHMVYENMLPT